RRKLRGAVGRGSGEKGRMGKRVRGGDDERKGRRKEEQGRPQAGGTGRNLRRPDSPTPYAPALAPAPQGPRRPPPPERPPRPRPLPRRGRAGGRGRARG